MKINQKAFQILGVSADSSPEEVRHAYRALVRAWHPDQYADDPSLQQKAQERLKEINEAYRQARRSLAARRKANLPDSPFRFSAASVTTMQPAASNGARTEPFPVPEAGQSMEKAGDKHRPIFFNLLLLMLLLLCSRVAVARYGASAQSITYILQMMAAPALCALVCNSPYGRSRRLRLGYLAALLLFGTVLAIDALLLKSEAPESFNAAPAADSEGVGRYPAGDAPAGTGLHPPLGPSERSFGKGPRPPSSPDAPTAPLAPLPAQPVPPAAPRSGD